MGQEIKVRDGVESGLGEVLRKVRRIGHGGIGESGVRMQECQGATYSLLLGYELCKVFGNF